MKQILFLFTFLLIACTAFSQPIIDIGLKGGVHTSKLNLESPLELNPESITKMHFGAFARVGLGKVYIQPEVYFSKKGSDVSYNPLQMVGSFDYKNVDVPVLLGYKLIKAKLVDLRVMAGPVFSFVTNATYPDELDEYLKDEFFNDHIMGLQYGLGVDVLFLTFDARVEHGSNVYDDPDLFSGKATTFMFSVGFKIL